MTWILYHRSRATELEHKILTIVKDHSNATDRVLALLTCMVVLHTRLSAGVSFACKSCWRILNFLSGGTHIRQDHRVNT